MLGFILLSFDFKYSQSNRKRPPLGINKNGRNYTGEEPGGGGAWIPSFLDQAKARRAEKIFPISPRYYSHPKRNRSQGLCKFWGQTGCIMPYVKIMN